MNENLSFEVRLGNPPFYYESGHVVYHLVFQIGDVVHVYAHRYRNLLERHSLFQSTCPPGLFNPGQDFPQFPGRRSIAAKLVSSPEDITLKRARELVEYFEILASNPRILMSTAFHRMLDIWDPYARDVIRHVAKNMMVTDSVLLLTTIKNSRLGELPPSPPPSPPPRRKQRRKSATSSSVQRAVRFKLDADEQAAQDALASINLLNALNVDLSNGASFTYKRLKKSKTATSAEQRASRQSRAQSTQSAPERSSTSTSKPKRRARSPHPNAPGSKALRERGSRRSGKRKQKGARRSSENNKENDHKQSSSSGGSRSDSDGTSNESDEDSSSRSSGARRRRKSFPVETPLGIRGGDDDDENESDRSDEDGNENDVDGTRSSHRKDRRRHRTRRARRHQRQRRDDGDAVGDDNDLSDSRQLASKSMARGGLEHSDSFDAPPHQSSSSSAAAAGAGGASRSAPTASATASAHITRSRPRGHHSRFDSLGMSPPPDCSNTLDRLAEFAGHDEDELMESSVSRADASSSARLRRSADARDSPRAPNAKRSLSGRQDLTTSESRSLPSAARDSAGLSSAAASFRPPSLLVPDGHNLEASLQSNDPSGDGQQPRYKMSNASAPVSSFGTEFPPSPASHNSEPLPLADAFSPPVDFGWQARPPPLVITETAGHTPFTPPQRGLTTENYGFMPMYPFGTPPFEADTGISAPDPLALQDPATAAPSSSVATAPRNTIELNSSPRGAGGRIDSLPSSSSSNGSLALGDTTARRPPGDGNSVPAPAATIEAEPVTQPAVANLGGTSRIASTPPAVRGTPSATLESEESDANKFRMPSSVSGQTEEKLLLDERRIAPPFKDAAARPLKSSNSSSRLSALLSRESSRRSSIAVKSSDTDEQPLRSILVNSPLYLKQRGFDSIMKGLGGSRRIRMQRRPSIWDEENSSDDSGGTKHDAIEYSTLEEYRRDIFSFILSSSLEELQAVLLHQVDAVMARHNCASSLQLMNMRELFKRLRAERESGALPQADATRQLDERVDSALSDHVGPPPPQARARVSDDIADVPADVVDAAAAAAAAADSDESAPGVEKKTPFSEKKDDAQSTVRPVSGPSSSGLSIALAGTETEMGSNSHSEENASPLKALSNKPPPASNEAAHQTRNVSRSAPASPDSPVAASAHHESSFASLLKSFNDFRHRTFAATSKDKKKESSPGSRKKSDTRPRLTSTTSHRSNANRSSASHSSNSNGNNSDGFMSGFTGSGATRVRQKSDSAAMEKSHKHGSGGKKRGSAPAQVYATPVSVGCIQPRPRTAASPKKQPQQISSAVAAEKSASSSRAKGSAKKASARSQVSRDEKSVPAAVRTGVGGSTSSHLSLDLRLHRETMAQAALSTGTHEHDRASDISRERERPHDATTRKREISPDTRRRERERSSNGGNQRARESESDIARKLQHPPSIAKRKRKRKRKRELPTTIRRREREHHSNMSCLVRMWMFKPCGELGGSGSRSSRDSFTSEYRHARAVGGAAHAALGAYDPPPPVKPTTPKLVMHKGVTFTLEDDGTVSHQRHAKAERYDRKRRRRSRALARKAFWDNFWKNLSSTLDGTMAVNPV